MALKPTTRRIGLKKTSKVRDQNLGAAEIRIHLKDVAQLAAMDAAIRSRDKLNALRKRLEAQNLESTVLKSASGFSIAIRPRSVKTTDYLCKVVVEQDAEGKWVRAKMDEAAQKSKALEVKLRKAIYQALSLNQTVSIVPELNGEEDSASLRFQKLIEAKYTKGLTASEVKELDRLELSFRESDRDFYGPIIEQLKSGKASGEKRSRRAGN